METTEQPPINSSRQQEEGLAEYIIEPGPNN